MSEGAEIVVDVELARRRPGAPLGQLTGRTIGGAVVSGPWSRLAEAKWLGPYTPTWVPHSVRKLMRRDGQIALGLAALKSPFFGIEYRLVGGDPGVRGFLRRTVLESPIFDKLVWSCLNSLDFGFQSHELVWDLVSIVADPEGGGAPIQFPAAYVLRKVKDLDPEFLEIVVDEQDDLQGIRFGAANQLTLPAEKVLHSVNQEEFGSLVGEAILDRAYNPWFFCNVQYLLLNRYLEQRGNPPLIGTAPNEIRYDESRPRDSQTGRHCLDVLNEQMVALRSGGACAIPFEVDDKGNQKWSIRVLEDGGRTETFLGAINHYNAMKLRSLYVPERIATQDTQTGSFAMVSEHVDVFFSMLEVIKRLTVLRPLQELVEKVVRANFGRAAVVPIVTASELSRFKSQLLGDVVKQVLSLPRTAPDGSQFLGADLVDLEKTLEAANVPTKQLKEFMASLKARGPMTPPATERKPFQKSLPTSDPAADPTKLARGDAPELELEAADEGGQGGQIMQVNLRPVFQVPQAAAPVVTVTNNVPQAAAPVVNVTNKVPQAAAPVVNMTANVVAAEPKKPLVVEVNPESSARAITIERDASGKIVGASVRPTD